MCLYKIVQVCLYTSHIYVYHLTLKHEYFTLSIQKISKCIMLYSYIVIYLAFLLNTRFIRLHFFCCHVNNILMLYVDFVVMRLFLQYKFFKALAIYWPICSPQKLTSSPFGRV